MAIEILGLHLSPRKNGNSAILLDEFMKGAQEAGAETVLHSIADLKIKPCIECGSCDKTGHCAIKDDDMSKIYPLLETVPKIVVSTSLFFYDVPAQGKALIDRTQPFWARRYLLGKNAQVRPGTKGFMIALGGSKGKDLFEAVSLCIKYFFDALSLPKTFDSLGYRKIDAAGEIKKFPEYLAEARAAGRAFAELKP